MATKAELRDQALEMIRKKALGQGVANELKVDMEQSIDEVYADLAQDKLVTWSSTGSIPDDVLPHVKALAAFNRSDGVSIDIYNRVAAKASIAKREIRKIVAPEYDSIEDPTDF